MFDWIRNAPLELREKNKEKKAFRLIHANAFLLLHIVITSYIVIVLNVDTKIAKKRRFSDDSWKTSTWFQLGLIVCSATLQRQRNYNVPVRFNVKVAMQEIHTKSKQTI